MSEKVNENWDDEEQFDVPLPSAVTRKLFRKWRSPRFGLANPDRMNNPLWEWLVRSRASAYTAAQRFNEPSALEVGPGWCFYRSGRSGTTLPDGRQIVIAGEHEDSYDPDFFIYNDVVVLQPDGEIEICGYPREVFPPTDFHSATLVGNRILIIGCLGYPDQRRPQMTPVFSLDLVTFSMSSFPTIGPCPGWIHRHTAELSSDGVAITIREGRFESGRNINDYQLALNTGRWTQLTWHPWQVWQVQRADGQLIHLWQIRSQLMLTRLGEDPVPAQLSKLQQQFGIPSLEEELGGPADAGAVAQLYKPPIPHEQIQETAASDVHRIRIDGITVRYEEHLQGIEITFEGVLPQKIINAVVKDLQAKLARLERINCSARRT